MSRKRNLNFKKKERIRRTGFCLKKKKKKNRALIQRRKEEVEGRYLGKEERKKKD